MDKILYEVTIGPDNRLSDHTEEIWRHEGKIHREGGPATILRDAEQKCVDQGWWKHGKVHREDGPAQIYEKDGYRLERWYIEGEQCREDGPAEIGRFEGRVVRETWIAPGKGRHRENGPAHILRKLDTGVLVWEEWYLHDKLHRIDGPALTHRDSKTGEVLKCEHRVNGRKKQGPSLARNFPAP